MSPEIADAAAALTQASRIYRAFENAEKVVTALQNAEQVQTELDAAIVQRRADLTGLDAAIAVAREDLAGARADAVTVRNDAQVAAADVVSKAKDEASAIVYNATARAKAVDADIETGRAALAELTQQIDAKQAEATVIEQRLAAAQEARRKALEA